MSTEAVRLDIVDQIAQLSLHNPSRHNALSGAVVDWLHAAIARLAVSTDLRAVVLHGGSARSFCAGADLKERLEMVDAEVYTTVLRLREAVSNLATLPIPVIAAIHGACFGGGLELALACDLRIASPDAEFGLTEVSLGIIPGAGGTQRLPLLVGVATAKELIYTARRLAAREARKIGLVNRVVPRERLVEEALAVAARIAEMGPLAVRAAKQAIDGGQRQSAGLELEWAAYQRIIPTQDRREGLAAFAEKRPPQYHGR